MTAGAPLIPGSEKPAICRSCLYWVGYGVFGDCRRSGPYAGNQDGRGIWPKTNESEFCGSFEQRKPNVNDYRFKEGRELE
tara:strand:- start:312 stop:551 length:240 start_codon:yes stop_codon:yes gene_type:complete